MTINCCIRRSMAMQWIKPTQNLKNEDLAQFQGWRPSEVPPRTPSQTSILCRLPHSRLLCCSRPGLYFLFFLVFHAVEWLALKLG
jgi:hypothetical protein